MMNKDNTKKGKTKMTLAELYIRQAVTEALSRPPEELDRILERAEKFTQEFAERIRRLEKVEH